MQIQNPQRSGFRAASFPSQQGTARPMEGYTSFNGTLPRPKNIRSQDDVVRHYQDLKLQLEKNIRLRKSRGLRAGSDEKLVEEASRYINRAENSILGDSLPKQRVEDRLNPKQSRLGKLERPTYETRKGFFERGAKSNKRFWSPAQIETDIRNLERELADTYTREKERRLLERQLDLEVVHDHRGWEQEAKAMAAAGPKAQQRGMPEIYAAHEARKEAQAQAQAMSKAEDKYSEYRWGDRGDHYNDEAEALRVLGIQDPHKVRKTPTLFAQHQRDPSYKAELARLSSQRRANFDKKSDQIFNWALSNNKNPYYV